MNVQLDSRLDTQYNDANVIITEIVKDLITKGTCSKEPVECELPYELPTDVIKHFSSRPMKLYDYVILYKSTFVMPDFKTLQEKDDYLRWRCEMITTPKKYRKLWNQYKFIEALPKHEQKSIGWFNQRNNFITASAGADAIDESKYNTSDELLLNKLGLAKPFKENMHVAWGKKMEMIATLIYSHINNVAVGEFGMVEHLGGIPFLGASPDGICTNMTLDGQFSPLVGRMLEIKCVTFRKINTSGPEHVFTHEKPDPSIVPHYYWIQQQLQLECCDLEECDFWQCKLKDYWSERLLNEGISKNGTSIHTIGQGILRPINKRYECGTFIELLPKDVTNIPSDEKSEWYGKFIYPVNLDIDMKEKVKWAQYMKLNWEKHYPEYVENYKFGKILYFHLQSSHCYLVKRNREWFAEKLPLFKKFWDRVLYYRSNPEKQEELIKEIALKLEQENLKKEEEIMRKKEQRKKEQALITMDSDED